MDSSDKKDKKNSKIKDMLKNVNWFGVISAWIFTLVVAVSAWYMFRIKDQIIFTVLNPEAVTICREGYSGEHAEATRRFRLKQNAELVNSPIVTETADVKK